MKFKNKILTGKLLKLNHRIFAGNYYYEFYNTYDDAINYSDVYCLKTKNNSFILALDEFVVERIDDWSSDKSKFYFIIKVLFEEKIFYMRTTVIADRVDPNKIYYIQNGNFDVIS